MERRRNQGWNKKILRGKWEHLYNIPKSLGHYEGSAESLLPWAHLLNE